MPDEATPTNEPAHNPQIRIEHSDASLKWVLWILAGAIVAAVLIHVFVYLFFHRWQMQLTMERQPLTPLPLQSSPLPPEPVLEQISRLEQTRPPHAAQMAYHLDQLRQYGPSDEKGYVQIPIDRAIEQISGKLPSRPMPPQDTMRRSFGLVDYGEPNSGRVFRKGDR